MVASVSAIVEESQKPRETFFRLIFGAAETYNGYICIAYKDPNNRDMRQEFFQFPRDLDRMLRSITLNAKEGGRHVYFCPQLFKSPQRTKENVLVCPTVWADLDTCDPAFLLVRPTVIVQSSPGRWQSLWVMDYAVQANIAENISRKIAYYHADQGADTGGWDISQLLRVPYTANVKPQYSSDSGHPIVTIIEANRNLFRIEDFDAYPEIKATEFVKEAMPEFDNEEPTDILQKFRSTLNPKAFELFSNEPQEDWSTKLWHLIQLCVEAGLARHQTFTVAKLAKCNKYDRDGRTDNDLWREVLRGYVKHLEITLSIPSADTSLPELMTENEIEIVQERETFLERYIKWATDLTDAAPQYHQAGALTLLSSLTSSYVRLDTSAGLIYPNLWFMVLADTTLTRKTTGMKIAINMLSEVDDQVFFATDGSMEGILTGLKGRDGKTSLYFRDEITGLIQSMLTKDYMSDMPEVLTKLYDGDSIKRLLRREELIVHKPRFLLLASGIKSKVQSLLSEEHIASGFIPRFVFITAETDINRIRPLGPKVETNLEWKEDIKNELIDIRNHYSQPVPITRAGRVVGSSDPEFSAELTKQAWERYNDFEMTMTKSALDTGLAYLTPVYDRLAKSVLKVSILIAASRQRGRKIVVELPDILHGIYYCRLWRSYTNEIVNGIGKSPEERMIDKIYVMIKNTPGGIARSQIMNIFKLTNKQAGMIFDTMIQRQLIYSISLGGQPKYLPT